MLRNQSLARRACPLCWERVEGALSAQRSCGACEATYHQACVQEMIRGSACPTMGCGASLRGIQAPPRIRVRSRTSREVREVAPGEPRVEETPRPVCSGTLCTSRVSPALERMLWPMVLCGECISRLLVVCVSLLVSVLILVAAC